MSNSPLVVYTKLSPNRTIPRKNPIDTITIHMVVGQVTAERLGEIFAPVTKQASSNYGVDKDGRVGMYVEEANRSWCTGTGNSINTNDHRAVTIEVASDTKSPYAVTEKAYKGTIDLCVDICKRNGKNKLLFLGNRADTEAAWRKPDPEAMYLTAHKWFNNTSCPGEFLYSRFPEIAKTVTDILNPQPEPTTNTITFEITPVKKGMRGEAVKQVQTILKGLGLYAMNVDGIGGGGTDKAIRAYQKANKLTETGIFDKKCWEKFLDI